mmetsp:Transcript_2053/g.6481  ORF Transcript_2053/g.6481 Transcript_2053/m.6481 type:complete len:596 (+) Transcript_2053:1990-3777(+)|eukprot:CAMPEP_0174231286 /NCGR_PEP_ID=MMETSP0417-20130205/1837_1 /TAXON_ID=242541 /ORGANISM="Mayorella sp, Strain BSH-02190019" /LENGTH=595 /DNA_ID=CAMNT_0015309141 /DNA_START=53 /DNA_END=1840 /DNA_ORIENTATION=+
MSNPAVSYLASQSGMDSSFSEEDDEISFKTPVVVVNRPAQSQSQAQPTTPPRSTAVGDDAEEEAPRSPAVDIHTSAAMFRRENEARSQAQETDEDRERREEEERLKREVWAEVEKVRQERQLKEDKLRKQRQLAKRRARAKAAGGADTPTKKQPGDEELGEKALELRRKREADRAKFRELRRQKQLEQQQSSPAEASANVGLVIAVAGGGQPADAEHCTSRAGEHDVATVVSPVSVENSSVSVVEPKAESMPARAESNAENFSLVDGENGTDEPVDLEDLLDDGDVTVNMAVSLPASRPDDDSRTATHATTSTASSTLPSKEISQAPSVSTASSSLEVNDSPAKQHEVEELRQRLAMVTASLEKEQKERGELQSVLSQYEQTVTKMLDEGGQQSSSNDMKRIVELEARCQKLEAENESLNSMNNVSKNKITTLQSELATAKRDTEDLREVIRNTTDELKDTAKNLAAARTALGNSEKSREEQTTKITLLQEQLSTATSQLSAVQAQVDSLKSSEKSLQTQLAEEKKRANSAVAAPIPTTLTSDTSNNEESSLWRLKCKKAEAQLRSASQLVTVKEQENQELVAICDELLAHLPQA